MKVGRAHSSLFFLALVVVAVVFVAGLGGCAQYQLRGTVAEGPFSGIEVVDASDPRLKQTGAIQGAVLQFTIDPDSLNSSPQGQTSSNEQGQFAKPIDSLGAGFLEYKVQVVARRPGYSPAVSTIDLPGSGKRLLVTMSRGQDNYKAPTDVLQDTMEMGKPYLNGNQ